MCKLLGRRRKFLTAFLPGVIFFSAASAAQCHAQVACTTPPAIISVSPSVWSAGQTFVVQITGTNFFIDPTVGICDLAIPQIVESTGQVSFPYQVVYGVNDPTDSYLVYEPTQINAVVTVPNTVPAENACVFVISMTMYAAKSGLPIVDPPPGLANGTGNPCTGNSYVAAFPVKIVAGGPTITSVAPPAWWAGRKQDITITGTNFLTASDPHGPTKLTVTGSKTITLTNVTVVSATEITATVEPAKDEPAETVTLTVTNPPKSSSPGSATASPPPVVLPVPVIQWRGKTISGDNAKTQKVKTGQPVELTTTPATLPGGFTVSQSTWNIDGTTIKSYSGDDSGITLQKTDLNKPNTSFYWLYPDDGLNATYDYCATGGDGTQYCASPQAKATFNASGPNSSLSTEDYGRGTIEQLNTCGTNGAVNGTAPYLGYGDLHYPLGVCTGKQDGTPGIELEATEGSGGTHVFVQLINADSRTYTYPTGGGFTCGPYSGLDTAYPYQGLLSADKAEDGPQMPLPAPYATGARNFNATMYLLWQPPQLRGTGLASIPVPIGYQQWQFAAITTQKLPIGSDKWKEPATTAHGDIGGFVPSQSTDPSYGYPSWTHKAKNGCTN
jgi:hypothetical protein